jgi:hypothetical protein
MKHIYKLYQNEPFVVPTEIIYNDNFGVYPHGNGFDDLLPFQNFSDFPSCVLGDFKLYIRVSPDAFVWCSVNPQESIKQMAEVYPFTENSDHEIFNYN